MDSANRRFKKGASVLIKAAIDDDLGINREDGAAVTAELVEIVVRMKAV